MAVMIALQLSVVAFAIWLPGGNAACPSFNINYPTMRTLLCPGDNITYTCAVSSTVYIVNTLWAGSRFPCPSNNPAITIQLSQVGNTSLNTVPLSCGNLSAVMTNISGTCYTSILTIPTPQYFNGTTVTCNEGAAGALIGSDTLNIQLASPPSAPTITSLTSTYSDQLIVTWTSVPTATSYSVSINDSVNTLVPIPSSGASQYMWIFTGLTSNTVYTVSVVAINCAGNSSLATISNRTSNGTTAPTTTLPTPTPTPPATSASTTPSSSNIAIGVGIGVGVGVPVLLALILVIVGVVYCTTRGGNKSKIRNEESSLDGSHPPPSKPPRVKNSSPPAAEARKPAAKPSGEGLVYADVNTAKGSGNKRSAPPPANDGVTYSGVQH